MDVIRAPVASSSAARFTDAQAAGVLGISYEALRQRLARARQRLTERIAELNEVPDAVRCAK